MNSVNFDDATLSPVLECGVSSSTQLSLSASLFYSFPLFSPSFDRGPPYYPGWSQTTKMSYFSQGLMAQACNPSMGVGNRRTMSARPAWATIQSPGQPGEFSKLLLENKKPQPQHLGARGRKIVKHVRPFSHRVWQFKTAQGVVFKCPCRGDGGKALHMGRKSAPNWVLNAMWGPNRHTGILKGLQAIP